MQIEITGLDHIDHQEELEFHEDIVNAFKNQYEDAFLYEKAFASNFVVKFHYDTEIRKFKLLEIPHNYKATHNRLVEIHPKIMRWF